MIWPVRLFATTKVLEKIGGGRGVLYKARDPKLIGISKPSNILKTEDEQVQIIETLESQNQPISPGF